MQETHQENEPVQITGTVYDIIWQKEEEDFIIFAVVANTDNAQDKNNLFDSFIKPTYTVTGHALGITENSQVEISGTWTNNKKYGWQIKLKNYEVKRPHTKTGIINYLSSGLIKGIGEATAKKIYKQFGDQTYDVLDNEPDRLSEIPGLGKKTVARIKKSWMEQHAGKAVIKFLADYDISVKKAIKVYETLGNDSIEKIRTNPYCLEELVSGIGFIEADKIAANLGVDFNSPFRIQSCVRYIMRDGMKANGHTCFIKNQVANDTFNKLRPITPMECELSLEMINQCIEEMIQNEKLIYDTVQDHLGNMYAGLYLPSYGEAEKNVADNLYELMYKHPARKISEDKWERITKRLSSLNIEYDETQLQAIHQALDYKVFILTGGPGTGKTTTTKGIITAFTMLGKQVLLAAPTGRAAKRMSEATGMEAVTIHRLLGSQGDNEFTKNEDDLLEGDVLIIDESSMIDIILMNHLVKAIPAQMSLIIIGDVDQLPSVGPGSVLRDLIECKCFPVVRLTKIFRQAQDSLIITNAHAINQGYMPQLPMLGTPGADCVYSAIANTNNAGEVAANMIVNYVSDYLPKTYDIDPMEIQVLIPMYKGDAGVTAVNYALQDALNPKGKPITKGDHGYRVGDKVIQLVNDYEKQVFNGTIGYIKSYNKEEKLVYIEFEGTLVDYELSELDEITLAYAITIHKSQGSEYPIVVMPVLSSYWMMLKRNLIYTGLTRAKKMMVMIGQNSAVSQAVRNVDSNRRNSLLTLRIRQLYHEGRLSTTA